MVVGAMLLSSSSSGLGIPKSPSFHSSSELAAAAKDFNFQTINSTESMSNNILNVQKQNIFNKMKNNNPFLTNVVANGDNVNVNVNANRNNSSVNEVSPVSGSGTTSSIRARDRNVYATPSTSFAVTLPLLRGLHYTFFIVFILLNFKLRHIMLNLLYPHYSYLHSCSHLHSCVRICFVLFLP